MKIHSIALLTVMLIGINQGVHGKPCVAYVADTVGAVQVGASSDSKPSERWPVRLMQCLALKEALWLANANAEVTLFYRSQAVAVTVRGAGQFVLGATQVKALAGAPKPEVRALCHCFMEVDVARPAITQGGVRMRQQTDKMAPQGPEGIVLDSADLRFAWRADGVSTPFQLRIKSRSMLKQYYEVQTHSAEVTLPSDVYLPPGEPLIWQVESLDGKEIVASRWVEFALATPGARAYALALDRQLVEPTVAERNMREQLLWQHMQTAKEERP